MSHTTTAPATGRPGAAQEPAAEPPAKGGKKKLLIAVVLVIVLAGAGWWFLLRPAASADAEPEPGEVLKLDAIQVNLADGHYLRIGLALQATTDAGGELDGSKALDATIDLFSGEEQAKLARRKYRTHLKGELEERLEEMYEGEVMGVYFTDFVTQ
jgi:flagellar FliL protein